jgi:hypothetical protein
MNDILTESKHSILTEDTLVQALHDTFKKGPTRKTAFTMDAETVLINNGFMETIYTIDGLSSPMFINTPLEKRVKVLFMFITKAEYTERDISWNIPQKYRVENKLVFIGTSPLPLSNYLLKEKLEQFTTKKIVKVENIKMYQMRKPTELECIKALAENMLFSIDLF